jgi:hypothetical protein
VCVCVCVCVCGCVCVCVHCAILNVGMLSVWVCIRCSVVTDVNASMSQQRRETRTLSKSPSGTTQWRTGWSVSQPRPRGARCGLLLLQLLLRCETCVCVCIMCA